MLSGLSQEVKNIVRSVIYQNDLKCLLCGKEGGSICATCRNDFFHPDMARCRNCGKLISHNAECCSDCSSGKGPLHLDKITVLGHYQGAWQDLIQKVKFHGRPGLLEGIVRHLADWAIQELPPPDALMAVPMHNERLVERGFNQAEVLTSALHWQLGIPLWQGLVRIRSTLSQVSLTRQERLHNLKQAFCYTGSRNIQGSSIWLVDDVTTTGATLEECARVLKESGAQEVYGLCLAAGMEK